ncbi:MAG: chorismate mutase, partial [Pirellulaceae bacterium]
TNEIHVPGSLKKCIRILIHWNTAKSQKEITPVYTNEAVRLRPDLSDYPPVDLEELEAWITEQMSKLDD